MAEGLSLYRGQCERCASIEQAYDLYPSVLTYIVASIEEPSISISISRLSLIHSARSLHIGPMYEILRIHHR
jgi:hypothetical protein